MTILENSLFSRSRLRLVRSEADKLTPDTAQEKEGEQTTFQLTHEAGLISVRVASTTGETARAIAQAVEAIVLGAQTRRWELRLLLQEPLSSDFVVPLFDLQAMLLRTGKTFQLSINEGA